MTRIGVSMGNSDVLPSVSTLQHSIVWELSPQNKPQIHPAGARSADESQRSHGESSAHELGHPSFCHAVDVVRPRALTRGLSAKLRMSKDRSQANASAGGNCSLA